MGRYSNGWNNLEEFINKGMLLKMMEDILWMEAFIAEKIDNFLFICLYRTFRDKNYDIEHFSA